MNYNWNILEECRAKYGKPGPEKKYEDFEEHRKQYQHQYYLNVTKPKRQKVRS